MNPNQHNSLKKLPSEKLIELIDILAKSTIAMDGVWFQSVESGLGMDTAILHDQNVWRNFSEIEARRIKSFLSLPDNSGLEGLKQALAYRFNGLSNKDEVTIDGNTLIYRITDCRVQSARIRKGMPLHPCKSVGIIEYTSFAKKIDSRFECEAISCYPEVTENHCACSWKFTLKVD